MRAFLSSHFVLFLSYQAPGHVSRAVRVESLAGEHPTQEGDYRHAQTALQRVLLERKLRAFHQISSATLGRRDRGRFIVVLTVRSCSNSCRTFFGIRALQLRRSAAACGGWRGRVRALVQEQGGTGSAGIVVVVVGGGRRRRRLVLVRQNAGVVREARQAEGGVAAALLRLGVALLAKKKGGEEAI